MAQLATIGHLSFMKDLTAMKQVRKCHAAYSDRCIAFINSCACLYAYLSVHSCAVNTDKRTWPWTNWRNAINERFWLFWASCSSLSAESTQQITFPNENLLTLFFLKPLCFGQRRAASPVTHSISTYNNSHNSQPWNLHDAKKKSLVWAYQTSNVHPNMSIT